MTGLEPPIHHKKKMYIDMDLHLNSSVILASDEKSRLKSDYMKRFQDREEHKIRIEAERAAGVKTTVLKKPTAANPHLNFSRRRILNDHISPSGNAATLDGMINRNKSPALMGKVKAAHLTGGNRDDFYN